MKEFAAAEWMRAQRSLDSARSLVQSDPDSAASRAYYAAFHALTAVLAQRGVSFSKHTEIRAVLHRDLIKAQLIALDCGRDYDFLMDLRETADYGGVTQATPANAALAVEKAERLVTQFRSLASSKD